MNKAPGEDKSFVEVAVALPVEDTFYYQVPQNLYEMVEIGKRVLVPFGKRRVTGYIVGERAHLERQDVKEILEILDDIPLFSPPMIPFYQWVSRYYYHPLGEVIKGALPAGITIEDYKVVRLAQMGMKEALVEGNNTIRSHLLAYLRRQGEVSLHRLNRDFKGKVSSNTLLSLEKEGLVSFDVCLKEHKIRPKVETFVIYRGDVGKEDRDITRLGGGPKVHTLLQILKERGEVSLKALKKEIPGTSRTLRNLKEGGLITFVEREVYRDPFTDDIFVEEPPSTLNEEQTSALEAIEESLNRREFAPFLLHGVTASGKTEIYLTAVAKALSKGRPAMVLVPEIALTLQLECVFRKRFGDRVAVLHSKLGLNVRYDQWIRVRKREADVVIGTRSAIFAPFDQPGLIIVDEEHDTSYKQEKKLRYNARDLAVVRAKMAKAVLILGSATPSIQSYYNVMSHKFKYLPLLRRVGGGVLPKVALVDMRDRKNKDGEILSQELKEAIRANLQRGEQTLLFLNRRGFAGFILCTSCGYVFRCLNCHISLTYHLTEGVLCCHYCGFTLRSPTLCRNCQGTEILHLGLGTERVEEEVKRLYPLARVARMDRDVMIGRRSYVKILKGLRDGTIDILIGTQMITKGHHFPNVTLVGVILADLSLNIPDFRASERTFQLLAQVAGRAGRGERLGEVMIQTYNPHYYSVLSAMNHDFFGFYKDEITKRSELSYPPLSHLINFKIRGNSLQSVVQYSYKLGDLCRSLQQKGEDSRKGLQVLGPVAAPLSKIKGKYRWQLLIKGQQVGILHSFCKRVLGQARGIRIPGVQLIVDVDPMNML